MILPRQPAGKGREMITPTEAGWYIAKLNSFKGTEPWQVVYFYGNDKVECNLTEKSSILSAGYFRFSHRILMPDEADPLIKAAWEFVKHCPNCEGEGETPNSTGIEPTSDCRLCAPLLRELNHSRIAMPDELVETEGEG